MYKKEGFFLLETLLALMLAAGVIFSMLNTYANTDKIMKKMDAILRINRDACLLCNQIERDISTALIGPFSITTSTTENQKKPDQKKEEPFQFFYASSYGDLTHKKSEYTMKMLRSLSIINSNPFLVYEEPKQRLARVFYELVAHKNDSKKDADQRYSLWRKETTDLLNTEAKEQNRPENKKEKQAPIYSHCLCDHVVSCYIFYHFPPDEEKNNKQPDADQKKTTTGKGETIKLPVMIDIELTIEDPFSKIQGTYSASFPVIACNDNSNAEKRNQQNNTNPTQQQTTQQPQQRVMPFGRRR